MMKTNPDLDYKLRTLSTKCLSLSAIYNEDARERAEDMLKAASVEAKQVLIDAVSECSTLSTVFAKLSKAFQETADMKLPE